ncbi:dihydrolipoyl dehydrogenase [Candidatus Nanohalobium constans]|uniref:Dihydrolipoyl dehydrogenase n=1 Tax=Candidatus Nanohalobium constans TaxID=2565781 RepID=A0A5Q0UEH7_9ARCH|nr:dihydrolipoyl dehydrogenase [Candidatus Nanohalobium constans]QGA79962.1 pyruvate dehydrogenase E3 component (dihydrolipoamide dehydrogenase) [Candidatus Nanohalobium constans]
MVVGDIATGTDLLVIGGGPAGYAAAIRAAQKGLDVTLVEKNEIGGTCLNRGCIPAKALIHAAKYQNDLQHWEEIGIHTENREVDFDKIQEWKESIVERLDSGVETMLKKNGVNYIIGEARFESSGTARIEEEHNAEKIEFDHAVIATGSKPIEIPGLEFEKDKIISSKELLNLEEVPDEIVVVGGGYIGMEAVTKFCKFGAKVKVVEARDRVLQNFSKEIIDEIQETSDCYNDEIYENHKAEEVKYRNGKAVLVADHKGEKVEIEGDKILVAAGRTAKPNLEKLGLESTEVEVEEGFVKHDKQMRTDDDNIFVVGDTAGQPMLAHKGYREGKVAGAVAAGEPAAFDNQYIPKVIYTDPEVAVVGKTQEEAEEEFNEVKVGKFKMSASGRALTTNHESGFVKVVASGDKKIQGIQIVAPRASDMIAEATLALEMQAYLEDIANTIHAHPTFPEALTEACEAALDECIHQ